MPGSTRSKLRGAVKTSLGVPLSVLYRLNARACPGRLLRLIGIATAKATPNFATLERIASSMEPFDGAVAECGVYQGLTLLGVAHIFRLRGIRSRLYGFDSFKGLPEPVAQDQLADGSIPEPARKGFFSDTSYEAVRRRFDRLGYDRVTLIQGYFEDTLPRVQDERFSLVHLDCDLYESYKTCLEFFYPRMRPGGYIVLDEYDFSAAVYPGAQKAIDEFLADKPEKLQSFDFARVRYFLQKL